MSKVFAAKTNMKNNVSKKMIISGRLHVKGVVNGRELNGGKPVFGNTNIINATGSCEWANMRSPATIMAVSKGSRQDNIELVKKGVQLIVTVTKVIPVNPR